MLKEKIQLSYIIFCGILFLNLLLNCVSSELLADWSNCEFWLAVTGDGGGAHQDEKRTAAQGDGGQIHGGDRPHEAAGEETQTHHQQVQVRNSAGF